MTALRHPADGCPDEEPSLAADGRGSDVVLDQVLIDLEPYIFQIAHHHGVFLEEVTHRFAKFVPGSTRESLLELLGALCFISRQGPGLQRARAWRLTFLQVSLSCPAALRQSIISCW